MEMELLGMRWKSLEDERLEIDVEMVLFSSPRYEAVSKLSHNRPLNDWSFCCIGVAPHVKSRHRAKSWYPYQNLKKRRNLLKENDLGWM
jgi:hypothetical protein